MRPWIRLTSLTCLLSFAGCAIASEPPDGIAFPEGKPRTYLSFTLPRYAPEIIPIQAFEETGAFARVISVERLSDEDFESRREEPDPGRPISGLHVRLLEEDLDVPINTAAVLSYIGFFATLGLCPAYFPIEFQCRFLVVRLGPGDSREYRYAADFPLLVPGLGGLFYGWFFDEIADAQDASAMTIYRNLVADLVEDRWIESP